MTGPKPVDKAAKGLNALVDEFTSAVKELVNAGEETAVHLAVGGGRAISAIIDATGEVTKVTVETAGNVAGTIGSSVSKIAKREPNQAEEGKKDKNLMLQYRIGVMAVLSESIAAGAAISAFEHYYAKMTNGEGFRFPLIHEVIITKDESKRRSR